MVDYTILTDSCCDLPDDMARELGIEVVPLSVTINGQTYSNYLDGREISPEDFYWLIRAKHTATTSAPNTEDFAGYMETALKEGKDVLYISFSAALSATNNVANMVAKDLSAKYPERKIMIVDSLSASLGQGLLVYLAALEKKKGKSLDEVVDYVERTKLKICHWFTVDDLFHLQRGGRLSTTSAAVGSILNIKPVLRVDNEGKLVPMEKLRGRNSALKRLAKIVAENGVDLENQMVFINHGDCIQDAEKLAEMVKGLGVGKVIINQLGLICGAHTGPGTAAVYFVGNSR